MKDTHNDILQVIESEVKSIDSHNMIWIRGSSGVGKSALAASILIRLQDQNRHVISFRFDHTQSIMTTTGTLWHIITCDLACLYPSFHQYLVKHDKWHSLPGINRLFEDLIVEPISSLGDVLYEKLLVIVIDALDKCGGLRHNLPAKNDYKGLLCMLKHWVQVDYLKRFKLVITSRPEDAITKMFPNSISTHVNIPSCSDVKLEDSASDDISVFLKS